MSRFLEFIEKLRGFAPKSCIEGEGFAHTYARLLEEMELWRARFDAAHVEAGCVVGVRADYSLSTVAALLALLNRRALVALIPRDGDSSRYLADAQAEMSMDIAVDGEYRLGTGLRSACHPLIERVRGSGDGGIIIFTSGSSGRPKAALHTTEGFFHKFGKLGRSMRTLAFLLLDHVAGLDTLFYTLANGGTLVITRRRDPDSIMQLIESHRIEVLPASPSFLRWLCAARLQRAYDLSSLRIITYGSEPMDMTTLDRLNARFVHVQISQKYGTTETGAPRTVSRANDSLWLKIKNDGSLASRVIDGVLWVRGEGTILGYLNAPSPFDEEGWYCTGDLVDVDGDWIRFRGRIADTINVGGEKVTPAEVEQVILELDYVRDAVVSGESHALMGEVVTARVTLQTESGVEALDQKEVAVRIRAHCRERLALYKIPVKVTVVDEHLASERQKARRRWAAP